MDSPIPGNLRYYLALNRMKGVGPRTVKKLKTKWPQLHDLFQTPQHQLLELGLPSALTEKIRTFDLNLINEDILWLKSSPDHHILTWESAEYPPLLKEIADPPIVLYAKGQLSALSQPKLAIIGSRNPSIAGLENAKSFAKELAACGVVIVSGLALGIDTQAHLGCLEAGRQTIAVLGTGIDCIYPRRHQSIAEQISQNGLLISEFPLKSPPIAGHFPLRNRIISGLSLCILVVEAAIKSGSLVTARMALEQNRDVLAIPGSIHNPMARGCHYLVQQGAKLVTSVADVMEELKIERNIPAVDKTVFSLASENRNLVKFIGFETTTIDEILIRSGYSLEYITAELAKLELVGTVVAVPGGYMRCAL